MLTISIRSVVNQLVQQELLSSSRTRDEALIFSLQLSMRYHSEEPCKRFSTHRSLHLVYHAVIDSNTVSVFSGVSPRRFSRLDEVELNHEISHDSCWTDLGIFAQIYFEMANEINAELAEAGLPCVAPAIMSEHNRFSFLGPVFSWHKVVVKRDPLDHDNYDRLIELI